MKRNWMVSPLFLYEMADASGGAAGAGAASGAGGGDGAAASGEVATPHVIEVADENALIRYPGVKEPVPFKNLRNFQAQWTKEAQKRSQVEKQLQEHQARLQQYEREREVAARRQSQGEQGDDIYAQLRELPYLSGEQAVGVVQNIVGQIAQRDRVLYGMAQRMQEMHNRLNQVYESHSTSQFDSRVNRLLEQTGYGPEYSELAKDLYAAYEGDDVDMELPNILKERVEAIERAIEARKQRAQAQRRQNAFVPGRGGNAGPSAPIQFKGGESVAEITDALWPHLRESGT